MSSYVFLPQITIRWPPHVQRLSNSIYELSIDTLTVSIDSEKTGLSKRKGKPGARSL